LSLRAVESEHRERCRAHSDAMLSRSPLTPGSTPSGWEIGLPASRLPVPPSAGRAGGSQGEGSKASGRIVDGAPRLGPLKDLSTRRVRLPYQGSRLAAEGGDWCGSPRVRRRFRGMGFACDRAALSREKR
jgi:hypothetical protein